MPTYSNTTAFAPSLGSLTINAFSRLQIRRPEITEFHMQDARMMANLMLSDWSIDVPNLWTVDLQTITLIPGQTTYTVDPSTVDILDLYLDTPNGDGTYTSQYLYPMSRTEYAAQPEKAQEGAVNSYWFDRLISPLLYVWNTPGAAQDGCVLRYYRVSQIMDANFISGQNVDIPYRFLEAFASGLAAKLGEIYPPKPPRTIAELRQIADTYWTRARDQDRELVPMSIIPGLAGYYGGR